MEYLFRLIFKIIDLETHKNCNLKQQKTQKPINS